MSAPLARGIVVRVRFDPKTPVVSNAWRTVVQVGPTWDRALSSIARCDKCPNLRRRGRSANLGATRGFDG